MSRLTAHTAHACSLASSETSASLERDVAITGMKNHIDDAGNRLSQLTQPVCPDPGVLKQRQSDVRIRGV